MHVPLITCLDASLEAAEISMPASEISADIPFEEDCVPPSDIAALPLGLSEPCPAKHNVLLLLCFQIYVLYAI